MIALRMPFYSVEKESKGNGKISLGGEHHEEVARLAENLSKLTKQELMYFGEVTEFKIWTDTLANLARSIKR